MNRKRTLSQISICLIVVSAISDSPAKATPLALNYNATDDENSENIIKPNQTPKNGQFHPRRHSEEQDQGKAANLENQSSGFLVDKLLNSPMESRLAAIPPNRPMSRVRRKVVHRPLFVYRHFHQRNSGKKPVRGHDDDDDDDPEEVPETRKRTGHEYARKQNQTRTDAFRYDSEEYQRFYNAYIASYKTYSSNRAPYIYGHHNQFISPSSFYYDA